MGFLPEECLCFAFFSSKLEFDIDVCTLWFSYPFFSLGYNVRISSQGNVFPNMTAWFSVAIA